MIRPADGNETVAAWRDAVLHDGPTALMLNRQGIEVVTDGTAVERGAGVVRPVDRPDVVLVGTGSEVAVCVHAAEELTSSGLAVQVVSMPSWDRFDEQDEGYRSTIFPPQDADDMVGIDRFGESAPGPTVLDKLGINVDHVVARARDLVTNTSQHDRSNR